MNRPAHSEWVFVGALFAVGAYAILLVFAFLEPTPDNFVALIVAPLLMLLTIPIATRVARADRDPRIVALLLIAVALKLVAAIVRYYVAIDLYNGLADAVAYHNAGRLLAPAFRSFDFDVATGHVPGTGFIEIVTGVIYTFTGTSRLTGFFAFAWLGLLGQILCWRAFRIGVPHGDSIRYACLILFFPSMLYWPSSIGKEGWVLFAIGITAYGVARLLQQRRLGVTLTVIGIAGVTMVRPHIALLLVAGLLAALLVQRSPGRSIFAPLWRMVSIGLVVALAVVVLTQTQSFLGVDSLDQETVQTALSNTESRTSQGGSTFTPVTVNTPFDVPLATVTVLFRPLPFEVGNAQMLATALEGFILAALCVLSWRRLATIPRLLRSTPYITFALVFVVGFVIAFSSFANFGILARQRTQVLPFLFVLLALAPPRDSRPGLNGRGRFASRPIRDTPS